MMAPMSQKTGMKIPKKNIHPCPFLSVIKPSVTSRTTYKMTPPKPIPHHMIVSLDRGSLDVLVILPSRTTRGIV
jgi:hypothetical protein